MSEIITEPGSLRVRNWKRFLRGPDPSLLEDLYVPALALAVRYDRCCSYFSSSVMSAAARGFGRLIERLVAMGDKAPRPAVRLVVNEELIAEDVCTMTETGDTTTLERILGKRFKNPKDMLQKKRLAMLGWLIKEGLLEVRVGVMRHGTGIVHAKFGIMTDQAGDAVVFSGSGNESARGLIANYERIDVSTSWDDTERHEEYAGEFNALWGDTHPDVFTVSLPDALRLKLIKFAPPEPPVDEPTNALARQQAAMVWRFIVEAPYLPDGGDTCDATAMVDLWPHQRHVVEEVAAAWPDGRLLCDEVGMGKTIEAVLAIRRLMAGRGVRRVLLLVPAGLLKQWQAELREKGGMVVPRLEGAALIWPDETSERTEGTAEALRQDILLMSRETARSERNIQILLAAEPWDLVLLDEAHAARRRKQEEGEFNTGNLLLNLLRQLQLRRRTRGILLLSATPMQTQPWEPWDLLAVLGEGGAWLADFKGIRNFYRAIAAIANGRCELTTATAAGELIAADEEFPPQEGVPRDLRDKRALATQLAFVPPTQRQSMAEWLRHGSPLVRRMHRNTRMTLRRYWEMGLLQVPPPARSVTDLRYDYEDTRERAAYDKITKYIDRRFEQLEGEKRGKGFVMTVYRRRASSSPRALERSLNRRRKGLLRVIQHQAYDPSINSNDVPEAMDIDDLPEGGHEGQTSASFPESPQAAQNELIEVEDLLRYLKALGSCDTKRDKFFDILRQVTNDGRAALVFTGYTDTMEYLRDALVDHYGTHLGCYSGVGGSIWDGTEWESVTKDAITRRLHDGELSVMICTDAASEGLNLQAAGAVLNYDLPWNPSKVEQRIGRVDRIGQKYRLVRVVNMFLKDSVDDKVYGALRRRCGIFEHFVGAMQPILERARRMLIRNEPPDPDVLEADADQLDQNLLAHETYIEGQATAPAKATPGVTRQDIEDACGLLTGDFGPKARSRRGKPGIEVSGLSAKKVVFAASTESLEANRCATPLSPLEPRLRGIVGKLVRPGERLPLVVGSHQDGPFRCSLAYWVGDGELTPVKSLTKLQSLVESWDGQYPAADQRKQAENMAARKAATEVRRRVNLAKKREAAAMARQLDACRRRLVKELGRYLVCVERTVDDLNGVFHRRMSRDIAGAKRLQKCCEKLGGYPEWSPDLCNELKGFFADLTEGQRTARLLGSELDAALDDPRWLALA